MNPNTTPCRCIVCGYVEWYDPNTPGPCICSLQQKRMRHKELVAETIKANEYEFTKNGKKA